jgi:DNA invertase Pin-like site-specific DNA recombinase
MAEYTHTHSSMDKSQLNKSAFVATVSLFSPKDIDKRRKDGRKERKKEGRKDGAKRTDIK